jgi:lambda family phage portal protein
MIAEAMWWLTDRVHRPAPENPSPKQKKRRYDGAAGSRFLADFVGSTTSSDAELQYSLRRLRDRARELCRNDDYARRYLQLMSSNVVGEHGFTLQSRARNLNEPNVGQLDAAGNEIIERAFRRWGKSCSANQRQSWLDIQRLVIQGLCRDGEILIRFVRGKRWRDGLALQVLEPDFLDEEYFTTEPKGRRVVMGVELDEFDAPVAYYLKLGQGHPFDTFGQRRSDKRTRVPAEDILHIYLPDRAQQTRGVTWFASAMSRMRILSGYEEAELIAARTAAAKMGFLVSADGEGFIGDESADGNQIMSGEPGSIQQLPAGMSFQEWNPSHPTSAYAEFHKGVLRGIASGLGISYTSLSNNLEGVSYSSIRQGALEERDLYRQIQSFLIQHLCEPVAQEWLKMSMTSGSIPIPITRYDKFSNTLEFRGRGFSWVDPAKEIRAEVEAVRNGFKSLNDVARQYGRDVEEVFQQMQADKEMAERYGISLAFEPLGSPHGPVEPEVE